MAEAGLTEVIVKAVEGEKLASTAFVATMLTVHAFPDAVSHPVQPEKAELLVGAAVRAIRLPEAKAASHTLAQLVMPIGELVTIPLPLPPMVSLSATVGIVKLVILVPVPPEVVTVIRPLEAPDGTVALIDESELVVNTAAVPLNWTDDAPVKYCPVSTTWLPIEPLVGKTAEMMGAAGNLRLIAMKSVAFRNRGAPGPATMSNAVRKILPP